MPESLEKVIMIDADLKFKSDAVKLYNLFDEFSDDAVLGKKMNTVNAGLLSSFLLLYISEHAIFHCWDHRPMAGKHWLVF